MLERLTIGPKLLIFISIPVLLWPQLLLFHSVFGIHFGPRLIRICLSNCLMSFGFVLKTLFFFCLNFLWCGAPFY